LQKSLDAVKWERTTHSEKLEDDLDEKAIKALLEACMLRNLGKYDEARAVLQNEILNHERYFSPFPTDNFIRS